MKKYSLILMAFALTGCAFSAPPMIVLEPQISIVKTAGWGNNSKAVTLQVIDARSQDSAGSAVIEPAHDIVPIFSAQIAKGLTQAGFKPVAGVDHQITVEILSIDYHVMQNRVSSNVQILVSARAAIKTPAGTYTRTYSASRYSDAYLKQAEQSPSTAVNAAVNQVLNNMLNDPKLIRALAK